MDKVKVKGKQHKLKSMRKALQSVWSKEEIEKLERRLTRFREELNLHVTVDLGYARVPEGIDRANRICATGKKSLSSS